MSIFGGNQLSLRNMTFEDSVEGQVYSSVTLNSVLNVGIDGMFIRNYSGADNPLFAAMRIVEFLQLSINNSQISNSNLGGQQLLGVETTTPQLIMSSVLFENVTFSSNSEFFSFTVIQKFELSDITLNGVRSNDASSEAMSLFFFQELDLATEHNSSLMDFRTDNTSVRLVYIERFVNASSSPMQILTKNGVYSNVEIQSTEFLFQTTGLVTDSLVELVYENITFDNIVFQNRGYLFFFAHQLPTNVSMVDCTMTNIENGSIQVLNPGVTLADTFSRVKIENLNVDGVKHEFTSFMTLSDQGKYHIANSRFINMYSNFLGSVVLGGPSFTETVIESSVFMNNTSPQGGVFYMMENSFVRCTNCTISNNFGITSGVVQVELDGYYEFYDSDIFDNLANASPVSQILASASLSVVSN